MKNEITNFKIINDLLTEIDNLYEVVVLPATIVKSPQRYEKLKQIILI